MFHKSVPWDKNSFKFLFVSFFETRDLDLGATVFYEHIDLFLMFYIPIYDIRLDDFLDPPLWNMFLGYSFLPQ